MRDAGYVPALELGTDPGRGEEDALWRGVYLGRYMRLSPEAQEGMQVARLWRYVQLVSDMLRKEAGPSRKAEGDYI